MLAGGLNMWPMKCDRCGKTFAHLHTVDVVVDRDYGQLAAQLKVCQDCTEAVVEGVKAERAAPATS